MFKMGSFEEELAAEMRKSLISNQSGQAESLSQLSKAADYINSAAELLDNTGFKAEADMLTAVLTRLATGEKEHIQDMIEQELASPEDEKVIIEPLADESFDPFADQEIAVTESGRSPLMVGPNSEIIEELPETVRNHTPEYIRFNSIASKIAAKKKV